MSESRILYTPRQHKPKQKNLSPGKIRLVLAGTGLLLFLVVCVIIVRLPFFQIREVKVTEIPTEIGALGTEQDSRDIQTKIDDLLSGNRVLVIPKRFIFSTGGRAIEKHILAALPRFAAIAVAKQFPHGISVSYTKRIFFALLCNDAAKSEIHSCGYIDRTGFVYEDAPEASGSLIVKIKSDLPTVKVGTQAIDEPTVKQMGLFGDGMKKIAGLRLTTYALSSQAPDELRMHVAEGFTVIVKKDGNPEAVLQILRTVLDQEIKTNKSNLDYIDLRLGNKVFYKYRGGSK